MTLKEVQFVSGINSAQMSMYERGEKVPTLRTAFKLAALYGVTVDVLFRDFFIQD